MDINIVEILNTGVTGFAFLMLFLGYRLTSSVQSRILDKDPNDFKTIEVFQEWKDLVCIQMKNTRYFMLFAVVFFAGGLMLMLYNAENKIIVAVSPVEDGARPMVRHQNEIITLNSDGSAEVMVRDEQNIVVSNDSIIKELNELRLSNAQKQDMARKLVTSNVASSTDAGFGDL